MSRDIYSIRKTLLCNHLNCNDCLLSLEHEVFDKNIFLCSKFGDKSHGLIPAKFCDSFQCICAGCERDSSVCINCRGFEWYGGS